MHNSQYVILFLVCSLTPSGLGVLCYLSPPGFTGSYLVEALRAFPPLRFGLPFAITIKPERLEFEITPSEAGVTKPNGKS